MPGDEDYTSMMSLINMCKFLLERKKEGVEEEEDDEEERASRAMLWDKVTVFLLIR